MVNDCRNRFWLLARAVGDNCSTLRAQSSTTVSVVKGFAIAGFWLHGSGILAHLPTAQTTARRVLLGVKRCQSVL